MIEFLRMIRNIERRQEIPLFFLVENVVFTGDDLEAVREASGFDFDPIEVDAMYFSPCCRKRHFITNIPVNGIATGAVESFDFEPFYEDHNHIPPASCLEEG